MRNMTYENLLGDIEKQRKKEKALSWRDREMFIDETRAATTTMGEQDNKKAMSKRQKEIKEEMMKLGLADAENSQMSWDTYYKVVSR